ncbi:T9SS type A sorting domain-containing protein [Algoriphagus namhaensis]
MEGWAQNISISGPTTVCPNNFGISGSTGTGNTYIATAKLFGNEINCSWQWFVSQNGLGIADGFGRVISDFIFPSVGTYKIEFFADCNTGTIPKAIYVNSRVKTPNPIQPVTNPLMCNPGQAYTFETAPPLSATDTTCYFHYDYEWQAPTGWDIDGGGNVLKTLSADVPITAPANTPSGVYTISVRATIPSGISGVSPYRSSPVTYNVQVGSLNSSQISVAGQQPVCPGNSYTYSAVVPGGHKNGYTYSWTYPSGWTVQSSNANQITLYVPSFNPSYGTVRVSVDTGCTAPTGFSGITVFPCQNMYGNYMIYPNPAEGELNIEYILVQDLTSSNIKDGQINQAKNSTSNDSFKVELYDRNQNLVRTGNTSNGKIRLNTYGLKPGIYFLQIQSGEGLQTEQIIVK